MKISVVIPTYRRAESLHQCLTGLRAQIRAADEVLIVAQTGDEETLRLVESWKEWGTIRLVETSAGGQVNQLNCGLEGSRGDVIAITDDDAVPRPEWLRRIEKHFSANPDLGGVGGRDFVQENGSLLVGDARLVGTVQWFGRVAGNHHIGERMQSSVDILKGANMAYRTAAIGDARFDGDLRGRGAQTCNDMAFSLEIKRRGWRLMYDPEVAVDHFPARRFDLDRGEVFHAKEIEDGAFNFYLALRRHMRRGLRRHAALLWARFIGVTRVPGVIRGTLSRLRGDRAGVEMRAAARRAWRSAREVAKPMPGVPA